jgi:general secretion pathway protein G
MMSSLVTRGLGKQMMPVSRQRGVTLLEMIVVITILLILMGAAVPVAKVSVRRQREIELRRALWEMRSAIDRYKDAADKNAFRTKLGS